MVNLRHQLLFLGAGVLLGWGTASWVRWARQQLLQWLWPLGGLKLDRPLVSFDIESTGLNVSRDRVLEIAAVKVWPNGKIEVKGPQRLNPNMHIPAEVTAIHHITQEDLVGCPKFADVAAEWKEFMEGCDLVGYNAKKFDVPILRNEFRRCGHFNFPPLGVPVVDAFRIFCQQEPRTLSAAVSFYCGRPHSKADAHSALGDAWATLRVLVGQVRRYGDLPQHMSQLAALCAKPSRAQDITPDSKFQWRGDQPIVAFGKYSGEPIAVLIARHRDHLMWMSGQDWDDESLMLVGQALKGLLPTKQGGWEPLFDTPPPDPFAPAAAGAAGSTNNSNNRQRRQQRHEEQQAAPGDPTQQPQQQQGAQQLTEQQQVPSEGDSSRPADAGEPSSLRPKQASRTTYAAAPPPPEFTGWPELGPGAAATTQNPDSWAAEPSTVADGWSLLETVNYGGNPEPQQPSVEPEDWDSSQQHQDSTQQQDGGQHADGEQQQQQEWQQGVDEGAAEGDWQQEEPEVEEDAAADGAAASTQQQQDAAQEPAAALLPVAAS